MSQQVKVYRKLEMLALAHMDFSTAQTRTRTGGALISAGVNSSDPVLASEADTRFINLYFKNSATSGDNRGIYLRMELSGAGAGGDALRAFIRTDVACSTIHGAHLSLVFGSSGSATGLACGSRSTLQIPNATMTGGTYCGAMSEIFCDGTSSDISGTTAHSIHRFVVDGGDSTSRGKVYNAFEFAGIKSGTGSTDMLDTGKNSTASTDGLRVIINGGVYYILLASA